MPPASALTLMARAAAILRALSLLVGTSIALCACKTHRAPGEPRQGPSGVWGAATHVSFYSVHANFSRGHEEPWRTSENTDFKHMNLWRGHSYSNHHSQLVEARGREESVLQVRVWCLPTRFLLPLTVWKQRTLVQPY